MDFNIELAKELMLSKDMFPVDLEFIILFG